MRRAKFSNVLLILAVLGVFAAFDLIGHRNTPYFAAKLICVLAFSTGCLFLTRQREAVDTFSAVLAGLFALCAVAMTAGNLAHPNWWPFFLGFTGAAILLVFLTQKKRETLLAIAVIVGFRLIVFVILYVLSWLR